MTKAAGRVVSGGEVAELEMMTRALIGITLQSLEVLGHAVSLPQFRLLLAASALGRAPSSRLAEAAGVPASSVTRLADKLAAAGLLARGADEHSRSIVTIEITEQGRDLVARVVDRRHELLGGVLSRMAPEERAAVAASAARFTALAADAAARGATGPLPLLPAAAGLVPAAARPAPGSLTRPASARLPNPPGQRPLPWPRRPAGATLLSLSTFVVCNTYIRE
jgi:DNA-binding MarR family transcriptional regulator